MATCLRSPLRVCNPGALPDRYPSDTISFAPSGTMTYGTPVFLTRWSAAWPSSDTERNLIYARNLSLSQLNRNSVLRKTCDLLKKNVQDPNTVEIIWKKMGSKDREVQVNKIPAFRLTIDDNIGTFLDPFSSLQL